jgi:hypothetical protein
VHTVPLARRRAAQTLLASGGMVLGLTAAALTAQQVPRFGERVEVARVIVDVRVLDERGDPILRLSPEDFKVRIDGRLCRVETATWVGGSDSADAPPALDSPAPLPPVLDDNTARLIVFVFQITLEPLPGSKALVLVGHGFGRLSASGMSMAPDYDPARRALVAARTSVFSLDVTDADYHSLEVGLQIVAEQTGGFYQRTHIFSDLAMRRLAGVLAGYYVLFVEKPETVRRTHDVEVDLTRRKGVVHATSSYAQRADEAQVRSHP